MDKALFDDLVQSLREAQEIAVGGAVASRCFEVTPPDVTTEQKAGNDIEGAAVRNAVPNRLTAETLAKSERGEDVSHAKDAKDLFEQLGI